MWIKTQNGCLVNTDKVSMIGIKSEEENEGFFVFLVVCVFEQNKTKEVFELGRYSNSCDLDCTDMIQWFLKNYKGFDYQVMVEKLKERKKTDGSR